LRIISKKTLREFSTNHPNTTSSLDKWYKLIKAGDFATFVELRNAFPAADQVTVNSGEIVTVFNIGGNKARLIAAIHYNKGLVFVLAILTHQEYDQEKWKENL
jgi:mRNA interferase HigB